VASQPRRVVFDSTARLPLESQLVAESASVPLTVVVSRAASRTATSALAAAGAQILVAAGENAPARVTSALEQLGSEGVTSVLLEGGPRLAGAFFDAQEIDELRLFVAPLLIGDRAARGPIEGTGSERIADALRASDLQCERIDDDLLLTARLREW
jgi:diaminohydroxyphosphoribosylaminopyrimidine deaminase / 5-amino-6-(5-phosphoribosylamino)uracil reductase